MTDYRTPIETISELFQWAVETDGIQVSIEPNGELIEIYVAVKHKPSVIFSKKSVISKTDGPYDLTAFNHTVQRVREEIMKLDGTPPFDKPEQK